MAKFTFGDCGQPYRDEATAEELRDHGIKLRNIAFTNQMARALRGENMPLRRSGSPLDPEVQAAIYAVAENPCSETVRRAQQAFADQIATDAEYDRI